MVVKEVIQGEAWRGVIRVVSIGDYLMTILEVFRVVDEGDPGV